MRKYVVAVTAVVAAIAIILALGAESPERSPVALHARLVGPDLYKYGVYSSQATLEAGSYEFNFVPSGSSPRLLSIHILQDGNFLFSEDFKLKATEQGSGDATYFTWDYLGQKELVILEQSDADVLDAISSAVGDRMEVILLEGRDVTVLIDPHGETMGSVTVQLVVTDELVRRTIEEKES